MINEIMFHPSSETTTEEYIELHNTGATSVSLDGWSFTSGVSFTFPSVAIAAGGYLVVAADRAAFAAKYPAVTNVVAGWSGRLSNSADSIVLKDSRGVKIDQVDYADDGDWATRERDNLDDGHRGWRWRSQADGQGKSLELINAAFDNNRGQNWGASTTAQGTPGAANSIAASDIAPVVTAVRHFPLVPTSTQAVTVNATVLDDRGVAVTVTVSYRRDGTASWTSAPMFDDGAHDDGAAGDHVFGAGLPAAADGTIMEFYISATDGTRARTWPAPALNSASPRDPLVAEQSQNCLYQVDNKIYTGTMPVYRVVMKSADRTTLTEINLGDGGSSHAHFNATFITVDGTSSELRYSTGVRNRGHSSATRQPESLAVAIPNDRNWKGRTTLNLNSQYTHLQLLGSAFLRHAGLSAPESRQIQVRVNNADPTSGAPTPPTYGFYVCNEYQDSDFASHHFPNDSSGNIYAVRRTDWPPYQEGDFTYLPPAGLNGGDPYRNVYSKNTNTSEDNWSDLIALTQTLAKGRFTSLLATPTWDADYVTAVQAKVDVDQWMRWFAAQALIGNGETNLGNGYGDDFYLYIGVADPRARLIPYDLDTVLGDGDSPATGTEDIFQMIRHVSGNFAPLTPTPLYPFLRHPTFAPLYFAKLQDLLSGPLSIENVNALVDQVLKGVVDAKQIADRKAWYAWRHAYVSELVNARLGVTGGPAVDTPTGYPMTRTATCNLVGKSDPARTQSVKVNGVAANYVPWKVATTQAQTNTYDIAIGEWSLSGVALLPGINRVLIQAFDTTAAEIERTYYEVWYDDGSVANVAGTISSNTTWTAAGGPYRVTAPLTVSNGVTLTIEPGATIYLAPGVGLTVAAGGRILAEGTEAKPIYFTRAPGTIGDGGTILINGAAGSPETHLYHVFFNHGGDPAVTCAENSNVILDYCEWLRTDVAYLHLDGGSFIVSNCIFPTTDATAYFEGVHGNGIPPAGGRAIIRDSFFGKCFSLNRNNYNDVVDFTGANRPGTLFQVYNNVFVGATDDVLDIDGTDAWIEGNIFMHVHRLGSPDSASAISGGDDSGQTSEITIVGNLFYDVDQVLTAKEGNFFTFLNNTVVDQNSRGSEDRLEDIVNRPNVFLPSVFNVSDDGHPGARGLYVEGNIIHSAEKLVRNYSGAEQVTFNNNLFPAGITWSGPGSGNTSEPAMLKDVAVDAATGASNIPTPTKDNYRRVAQEIRQQFGLDARSPARGTGPNGADKGGIRPLGVSLGGAPTGTTNATTATVTVGTLMTGFGIPTGAAQFPNGSGWTHYKWRLDGAAWSAETPTATPIALTGLANGTHTLEVVGKNDAGFYQDSPDLGASSRISSAAWRVDTSYVPPAPAAIVRINEVLASNTVTKGFGTVFPDMIELANVGNAAADLGGWGLTENPALPFKYTLPSGTTLAPGAHLVLYASSNVAVPEPKTGFALSASGDSLTLTRSAAAGGGIADKVSWGQQLADFSIGRAGDGTWALCRPTFGAANLLAAQAPASAVRINEWLTDATVRFVNDFIELYNPGALPVDIGGHFLSDNPVGWPKRSPIRALTFIPAGGFLVFKADGDTSQGADHANFKLSPLQGEIGFISPGLTLLDYVSYGPQRTDIAQGRSSDSTGTIIMMLPTPGVANPRLTADSDGDGMPDAWEIAHGFDPYNPADASLDADGDGQSNLAEYRAGTDPHNPKDFVIPPPFLNGSNFSRLINLSVLAPLTQGEVMTIGTVIGGAGTGGTKAIVVRAAGPALTQLGVSGVLPDPKLALINQGSGVTVAANDDWAGAPALAAAFAQVGAFPYAAATSKDAGLSLSALLPANYTVQVSDSGTGTGTVIAELYDATPSGALTATTPRLINVSVLKQIVAGTTLTAGFVIDGPTNKTVLVRAVGPTLGLAPFNIPGVMTDPKLELFDNARGVRIDQNNDWGGTTALSAGFASVGAFALTNASTKDAAILVTVIPGQYSVQVSSADGGGGVVIVEIYEVP
ncbi:MAG: lamin tail domain-containing protein [Opitutaceae bacterium]